MVDFSRREGPVLLGSFQPRPGAEGVAVKGRKAFLACGKGGLVVVDLSNPRKPKEVSRLDTPGFAHDVFVLDDLALVADGGKGLCLIDI